MLNWKTEYQLVIQCFFLQEECFAAFLSVSKKVNDRDADMRSHIVLSMFKVRQVTMTSYNDQDEDKDKDKDMRSHIVLSMFKVKTSSLWFQQDDFFFNHTSMKPWRSEIKCEVGPNLNYGDYGIEIE